MEPIGRPKRVHRVRETLGKTLAKPFELNSADYEVGSASVAHGRGGAVFRCTLSLVTDDTVEGLTEAIRAKRTIRFTFPKRPLVLEAIEVVRLGPGRIRLAGRVLSRGSDAVGLPLYRGGVLSSLRVASQGRHA